MLINRTALSLAQGFWMVFGFIFTLLCCLVVALSWALMPFICISIAVEGWALFPLGMLGTRNETFACTRGNGMGRRRIFAVLCHCRNDTRAALRAEAAQYQ